MLCAGFTGFAIFFEVLACIFNGQEYGVRTVALGAHCPELIRPNRIQIQIQHRIWSQETYTWAPEH